MSYKNVKCGLSNQNGNRVTILNLLLSNQVLHNLKYVFVLLPNVMNNLIFWSASKNKIITQDKVPFICEGYVTISKYMYLKNTKRYNKHTHPHNCSKSSLTPTQRKI